jgi:peptidoglycan/xylan/chitin deacetylase (PgdA/CDA1 family)
MVLKIVALSKGISVIAGIIFLTTLIVFSPVIFGIHASPITNNKVVIINFDDGLKTQFTHAKPILDKYGFKATFYVVCNYVDNKKGYMTWEQIETLNKEGHDIESHTMNHLHLSNLSKKDIKYEVGHSKKCLHDHGIEATSFAYPFNDGSNNEKIVKIVSKYYESARTANNPITFLGCDGLKDESIRNDCRTYSNMHHLTYAIRGWSHDFSRMVNSYDDSGLYERFIDVVNSQDRYNEDGQINGIPIIIYHRVGETAPVGYNTDLKLFDKEMKYLHDNGFSVLSMADLAYDAKVNHLYIKQFKDEGNSGNIAGVNESNPSQIQTFSVH